MKKGQTEMIGLVVIVILLIFIAIIYLRFANIEREEQPIKANIEVTNLLNSIMKYSCNNGQIKDLINNGDNTCDGSSLEEVIRDIMISLNKDKYKLTISGRGNINNMEIIQGIDDCREKYVDTYIKPRFRAILELCKNA